MVLDGSLVGFDGIYHITYYIYSCSTLHGQLALFEILYTPYASFISK